MPRRKRSEKSPERRPVERPKPERVSVGVGEDLQALCPVCGKTIVDRAVKFGGVTVGRTPYFETIDFDPNKPFGVAMATAGRGSFANWRYIQPEEAPELFSQVRNRLLQAIKEYLDKGWLTSEDIRNLL